MSSHRIQKDWKAKLKAAVPFGLDQAKPKHFRDMAAIAWRNRNNLGYASKVLSRRVCDGCAFGIEDWKNAKVSREQIEKSWRRALKTRKVAL